MSERMMDLTPNYGEIFKTMLREALTQGEVGRLFEDMHDADQLAALREVQRVLAPLNIAAQSMSTVDDVNRFRVVINAIVKGIDATANRIENEQAELRRDLGEAVQ